MQPYNEYYKIDPSKVKSLPHSWQEIDENIMNIVFEDVNLSNEDIEEVEDDSSYEQEEIEVEEEEEEEEEQELPLIEQTQEQDERKDTQMNVSRFEKKIKVAEDSKAQEPKVRQIMKVVKKKKKKYKDLEDSAQNANSKQDSNQNEDQIPSKKQKTKNDDQKFRSAMDEYIVQRPPSPPKKKPSKQQENSVQKKPTQPPSKVVQQMVGTPKQKTAKSQRVPVLKINQQSPARGMPSNDSPRPDTKTNRSKSQSEDKDEDEEEDVIVFQEEIIHPQIIQQKSTKKVSQEEPQNNESEIGSQYIQEDELRSKVNTNNTIPLDMTESPTKKKIVINMGSFPLPDQNNTDPTRQTISTKQEQQQQQDEEAIIISETPRDKTDSIQINSPREKTQSIAPNTPRKTNQSETPRSQNGRSPKADKVEMDFVPSGQNTPTGSANNSPTSGFQYLNNSQIKRKVGTGLLEDLIKVSYLLDFNVVSYKKERQLPDLPNNLEFKQDDDKYLFDSIFKWQYEVDLDIVEMEANLNTNNPRQNKRDDSDEDDDDDNQNNKSIHSSDITDFGDPITDKNSLQHVSSDGLSDVE